MLFFQIAKVVASGTWNVEPFIIFGEHEARGRVDTPRSVFDVDQF